MTIIEAMQKIGKTNKIARRKNEPWTSIEYSDDGLVLKESEAPKTYLWNAVKIRTETLLCDDWEIE